jgi:hypothetical protein
MEVQHQTSTLNFLWERLRQAAAQASLVQVRMRATSGVKFRGVNFTVRRHGRSAGA